MLFKSLDIHNFWQKKSVLNYLLLPLSVFWFLGSWLRKLKSTYESKLFVICLGNLNLGGSGKTPTAMFLGEKIQKLGIKVAFLSKGYGGSLKSAWVNISNHTPKQVGDEPLLLCKYLPTLVSKDMVEGLKILENEGFTMVITDDGFQNPTFKKDFNILVINGDYGFGNGLIFPSGPLRESINSGLKRADIIILLETINKDIKKLTDKSNLDIIFGEYIPKSKIILNKEDKVLAFCGIGMPFKFKKTLEKYHIQVEEFITFKDHYNYKNQDLDYLIQKSSEKKLILLTTQKDYIKIPLQYQKIVLSFDTILQLENPQLLLNKIISYYETKQKKIKAN